MTYGVEKLAQRAAGPAPAQHGSGQVPTLALVQVTYRGNVPARVDVHLIRPSRGIRHERGHGFLGKDDARSILLCLELVAVQAPACGVLVLPRSSKLGIGERRHERQRVDLAVRVMESDPDLLPFVLEDVHVSDIRPRAQGRVPICPYVDQESRSFHRISPVWKSRQIR